MCILHGLNKRNSNQFPVNYYTAEEYLSRVDEFKKISVVPGNEFYKKIVISNSKICYVRGNNLGLPSPPLYHGSFFYIHGTYRKEKEGCTPPWKLIFDIWYEAELWTYDIHCKMIQYIKDHSFST